LEQFLYPLPLDEFLDRTLVGGFRRLASSGTFPRVDLLGPNPESSLLDAFHLAPKLTFHSANPSGPPPSLAAVADREDFRRRIEEFHERNFSVRFPDLRPVSPAVDRLARALEIMLHQPVTASAFWSRGGMRAPVHFDDHDLIVVHLRGTKRWYVSQKPSELNNVWKGIPSGPPELGPHEIFDVNPGDLVYLPRGTLHSVDGSTESLHLSIGFTPLTLREAIIAALDQLSDLERPLRATLGNRLASQLRGIGLEALRPPVLTGVARLLEACRAPGFIESALQLRSGRAIGALGALPQAARDTAITLDAVMMQKDLAYCHLTANPEKIDFSYPGGHLYIHRGAEESLVFMVNTASFRVRDIPGEIDDEVRLSLAEKLREVGFLEVRK
jgi:hypothetical protein